MAQPQLKAEFFVDRQGVARIKAGPVPRRQAVAIYQRDAGVCQLCGARVKFGGSQVSPFDSIRSGCVDHIFPRSRGGQNTEDNLQLACVTCNSRKGARNA